LALGGVALILAAPPSQAATLQVTIEKLSFEPAEINAAAGDTIEWINKDAVAHTATADGVFDVLIQPHKSASFVLKSAGALNYFCRFHPNMRARIIVSAAVQ
jgi:plastocyanin